MPVRSNALRGYIYKDPNAANPLLYNDNNGYGYFDPVGTELYFEYVPQKGAESDPNAYINSIGQSIVDLAWLVSWNTNNPTKKLREFGHKNYRNKDSMIKQFYEAANHQIHSVPNGILAEDWQSESDDAWRQRYRQDKTIKSPERKFFHGAYEYAAWKRGESYRGRIIDDPNYDGSGEAVKFIDRESDIPKGKVFKDYPKVSTGKYQLDWTKEDMEKDIKDAAKRNDRRYYIRNTYGGYDLTERQVKNLGIDKIDDMKVGETKWYDNKDGITFSIERSKSPKARKYGPKKPTPAKVRQTRRY